MRNVRFQLLFRAVFAVGLVTLLMIDAFVLQNNNEVDRTQVSIRKNSSDHSKSSSSMLGQELQDVRRNDDDLSYVASKRAVPRGPDPIHNRRAGNSGRSPGKA